MKSVLLMGLPGTGKSTYLAALWHCLTSGEVECRFAYNRFVGSIERLEELVEKWRRCTPLGRTSTDEEGDFAIEATWQGQEVSLRFPDLSGERMNELVEDRTFSPAFVEELETSTALVMFVNANRELDEMGIEELNEAIPREVTTEETPPTAPAPPPKPWANKNASLNARSLELAYRVREHMGAKLSRLAIVVSAWDQVEGSVAPQEWLAREMPLLSQYLSNSALNGGPLEVAYFGVSSLGGDISDSDTRARLQSVSPGKWVMCTGSENGPIERTSDISRPFGWALARR